MVRWSRPRKGSGRITDVPMTSSSCSSTETWNGAVESEGPSAAVHINPSAIDSRCEPSWMKRRRTRLFGGKRSSGKSDCVSWLQVWPAAAKLQLYRPRPLMTLDFGDGAMAD